MFSAIRKTLCAGLLLGTTQFAGAVPLVFNNLAINSNTNVTGGGVSVTQVFVDGAGAGEALHFEVTGTVDMATDGGGYFTNAAGIKTAGGIGGAVGSTLAGAGAFNFGTLLVSTDDFATAFQIFPANAANGLGNNVNPPTFLTFDGTVGGLFGGGLAPGSTLFFRIADTDGANNAGSFSLSAVIGNPVGVPELNATCAALPFTFICLSLALLHDRRRHSASSV